MSDGEGGTIFDRDEFNQRLFFPQPIESPLPPGAVDLGVEVSGATLHLRWHRSPETPATLLLFHGNGEVVADYDLLAPTFARAGVDLAVVDFRGYGASSGVPTLRNTIADALRVLEAVLQGGSKPLLVMGRSLGSACAAEIYGADYGQRVRGVILESGFSDLVALIRRRGLTPPPVFTDLEAEVFDPLPKLRRGQLPLLVLHGAEDQMIAPSEARRAWETANTNDKKLVIIPDRGHNDVSSAELYWLSLKAFVTEHAH